MDFIREDNGVKGKLTALDGRSEAGILTYSWSGPDRIIVDYTEVYMPYRGQGVGRELVAAMVTFARENNIRILPLCSFVKKVMERNTAHHDVLFSPGKSDR